VARRESGEGETQSVVVVVVKEGSVIRLRGKEMINGWGLAGKCAYVIAIRLRDEYLERDHRIKLLPLKYIRVN
jgi:hypothetical protein